MVLILGVPLIVAILGMLIYLMASNPKTVMLGLIAFACGLLATLFAWGGTVGVSTSPTTQQAPSGLFERHRS
jgi:cytochrome c oxidase assembly factor CtaG